MKEIKDPIKDKIKEYQIRFPMYYDLFKYVLELEKKIKDAKL
jgi:hypothetical protein